MTEIFTGQNSTASVLKARIAGDAFPRLDIKVNGSIHKGDGTYPPYAPRNPKHIVTRVGAIGDSTTAGERRDTNNTIIQIGTPLTGTDGTYGEGYAGVRSWYNSMILQSGGKLINVKNAAVATAKTSDMVATQLQQVILTTPDACFIGDAINDITSGVPTATTRANIFGMIGSLISAGILPIIRLIYPNNGSAAVSQAVREHNAYLSFLSTRYQFPIVDTFSPVVDITNANAFWISANTLDGTHASYIGTQLAGTKALADMAGLLSGTSPILLPTWADPHSTQTSLPNLLPNALFTVDGNADGIADGWSATATTPSLGTATGALGQYQRASSFTTGSRLDTSILLGALLAVGDRFAFMGQFRTSGMVSGSCNFMIHSTAISASPSYIVSPTGQLVGVDYTNWTPFYIEGVVPPGTAFMRVAAQCYGGTGTIDISQWNFINMSKQNFV